MSIIGTRPPLISETNLYELHHPVEKNTVAAEALGISRHGMCWSSGLAEKTKHTEDTDHDEQSKNLP